MNAVATRRIFISHTKQESPIALLLKDWIDRHYGAAVESFVSESDIRAGDQWLQAVEEAVRGANLVIVLCSPVSIRKTWVIFEAGAAWGRNVRLLPVCHSGLTVTDLPSPLSAFQALNLNSTDFAARLAASLTNLVGLSPQNPISAGTIANLDTTVLSARQRANRFDVFLSAPMSSLEGSKYRQFRKSIDSVLEVLDSCPGLSRYYFAGREFGDVKQFDDRLVGPKRDLRALANSDRYLMILPKKLVSSALVEAGFALALGVPAVLFVRRREDLPYALQEIGQLSENTTVMGFRDAKDIVKRLTGHGAELWSGAWGRAYV
jgi:hypothetical protein